MSNPGNAAAQGASDKTSEPLSFADKVNTLVNSATLDDKGNLVLPTDIEASEELKYAATLEKRRRDTQSALSKTSQQLAAESKMRSELEKLVAAQMKVEMTPEDAERLEHLKFDDPEAWRLEMNKLEQKATTQVQEKFTTLSTEASQHAELTRRAQVLEDFNRTAQVAITDEVLENDIPPRIVKELETGAISFEDFLAKAHDYLVKPKKVGDTKLDAQPNLGNAGGSSSPSAEALRKAAAQDYNKQSF